MDTSLLARIFTDSTSEARALDLWLSEREVDKALKTQPTDQLPFTVDAKRLKDSAAAYDKGIVAGQIRILSPGLFCGNDALPYVAVLDRWMEDIWLVAPFSPYATPATDAEMTTGIPFSGLGALQCWNARTAHDALVERSYVVGSLGEAARTNALALFRHAATGAALPAGFSAKVGAPVRAKADPRREYLAESIARYAPLTAAAEKWEALLAHIEEMTKHRDERANDGKGFAAYVSMRPSCAEQPGRLAAGEKARETSKTFLAPAFNVEIDVKHASDEGQVRIVVYGKDGERDSRSLEGFAVVDKEGSLIGTIEHGVLVAKVDALASDFLLMNPETLEPVSLVEKESR